MHFRIKTFIPFAVLGAFLVLLALISPPAIYSDKAFMSGKRIEHELQAMRLYIISEGCELHPLAAGELPGHLSRVEEEVEEILNHSRWRQLWLSSVLIGSAGVVVMLAGLFVTLIASWKADVAMVRAKQTGEPALRE